MVCLSENLVKSELLELFSVKEYYRILPLACKGLTDCCYKSCADEPFCIFNLSCNAYTREAQEGTFVNEPMLVLVKRLST